MTLRLPPKAASGEMRFGSRSNLAVEAHAIACRIRANVTVGMRIRLLQKSTAELARVIVQEESLASVINLEDLRYVLG